MGTTYHITVLEQRGIKTDQTALHKAIDAELHRVNQEMSTYLPDSELSKLNRSPVGEPVRVSPDMFDVLLLSLEVSWISDGAFDITVGPLVDLWGFGPRDELKPYRVPDPKRIAELLKNVGFTHLEFDMAHHTVTKRHAMTLDLSGVAKGFGVDKVATLLDNAGYHNYMVEIGGELHLKGHSPRGTPWRIAIEEPNSSLERTVNRAVVLTDIGMATSGDYRNFFEQNGRRYSHTIDPKTGYPITHNLASVTVLAKTTARADALATALEVLGPKKGMQLAEQQHLPVYMIVRTAKGFKSSYSTTFAPYIKNSDH